MARTKKSAVALGTTWSSETHPVTHQDTPRRHPMRRQGVHFTWQSKFKVQRRWIYPCAITLALKRTSLSVWSLRKRPLGRTTVARLGSFIGSCHRYLRRPPIEKWNRRANWTIFLHDQLFYNRSILTWDHKATSPTLTRRAGAIIKEVQEISYLATILLC